MSWICATAQTREQATQPTSHPDTACRGTGSTRRRVSALMFSFCSQFSVVSRIFPIQRTLLIASAVTCAATASGCGPSTPPPAQNTEAVSATDAAAPSPIQIKPESIVTFPKGEIACLSKDDLQQALAYGAEGKATKMRGMFVGAGGNCIMLPADAEYRVIDAEYNAPDMPDAGVLEVVGKSVEASQHGAFTMVIDPSLVHIVKAP